MRIALYHNLREGGALRTVRETIRRSARTHEYHLYRAVAPSLQASGHDALEHDVAEVHDVGAQRPVAAASRSVRRVSHRAAALAELWSAEAAIAAQMDRGNYDLCVVHPCWVTQAPSLLTRVRTPTVYYAQEARRLSFDKPYADAVIRSSKLHHRAIDFAYEATLRWSDRRAMLSASVVACNSVFTAESLYRCYGREALVVQLGVDTELFRPSGANRGDYAISVGALEPMKGHALAIEALSLLPEATRPALQIAFERTAPGYESLLRELAKRRGVRLRLRQRLSDIELVELYSAARLTICAARLEPFGLTPLESLCCGTPVVAVNEGGFRETVTDGHNGLLVPPTVAGIAKGVLAVLEGQLQNQGDDLRSGVAARTWDSTVERLHALYSAVACGTDATANPASAIT